MKGEEELHHDDEDAEFRADRRHFAFNHGTLGPREPNRTIFEQYWCVKKSLRTQNVSLLEFVALQLTF